MANGGVIQVMLSLVNDAILRLQHALSATVFTLMVLFAVVDVSVFLETLRVTLWTGISHDHR
jgi:hypothetical protein